MTTMVRCQTCFHEHAKYDFSHKCPKYGELAQEANDLRRRLEAKDEALGFLGDTADGGVMLAESALNYQRRLRELTVAAERFIDATELRLGAAVLPTMSPDWRRQYDALKSIVGSIGRAESVDAYESSFRRLADIVDDHFGAQPVMSVPDLMAFLASKLFDLRMANEEDRDQVVTAGWHAGVADAIMALSNLREAKLPPEPRAAVTVAPPAEPRVA